MSSRLIKFLKYEKIKIELLGGVFCFFKSSGGSQMKSKKVLAVEDIKKHADNILDSLPDYIIIGEIKTIIQDTRKTLSSQEASEEFLSQILGNVATLRRTLGNYHDIAFIPHMQNLSDIIAKIQTATRTW